jgi:hypothetical protein
MVNSPRKEVGEGADHGTRGRVCSPSRVITGVEAAAAELKAEKATLEEYG